jgi:uncharacterized protein (DUF433 family)
MVDCKQNKRYGLALGMKEVKHMVNLTEHIEINPKILLGKPVIRGTRIPVELIVKLIAQGWKNEEILKEYPVLEEEDIRAALFYAEKVLEEEEVFSLV